MVMFWIWEILIIYFLKKSITIQLSISLVSISCPVCYVGFSSVIFSVSTLLFFSFPLSSGVLCSSCGVHGSLCWVFLRLVVVKRAGWRS